MNHGIIDDPPPAEMLGDDPLEQRRTHLAVPHAFRVYHDDRPAPAHAKARCFPALDARRTEQESLTLEQSGKHRVQLAAAPVGRAEATSTHQDVSRVRFHDERVSVDAREDSVMRNTIRIDDLVLDSAHPAQASRPPILMAHGIMGGAWYFAKWLEFFAARGHPSYALNLRGHHGSRPVANMGKVSVMDYVTDMRDAARGVAQRHDGARIILVGHSMGGLIAQKAAESLAPEALVLLSSAPPRGILLFSLPLFLRQTKHVPAMLASRPVVADPADNTALFLNRLSPAEALELAPRWTSTSGRAGREMTLGSIAVDADRITCPVIVVAGADDIAIPPRIQRKIARKYDAQFRVYDGHAHFLIWEPGWERIADDVAAWLEAKAA